MNTIMMVIVALIAGIAAAMVIGLMIKRSMASVTYKADLTADDKKELIELKLLCEQMKKDRVEQNEAQANRNGQLEERIDALGKTNTILSTSVMKLDGALRGDSQVMGAWGEMQLKKVLEMSGLTEGISYTYQETLASEGSMRRDLRTDVQVKLPNNKVIVIDAKNTLPSYLDYNAAETDEDRELQKGRIIDSVRKHMDEIINAKYQANIKSCFPRVIMYFPFEIPYLIACRAEIKVGSQRRWLREYAYEKGVIFATAANLLPILEGVATVWAAQNQDEKMDEFLASAEKLCAKANTFLSTYNKLGKLIFDLGKVYKEGMGQLATGSGNLIGKLSTLKDLNVDSAKKLVIEDELMERANMVAGDNEGVLVQSAQ